MTEAEWLISTEPRPMLDYMWGRASDRKFRLFQVACCRRIWDLLPDEPCRDAVLVAERYADGEANDRRRQAARSKMVSAPNRAGLVAINAFGDVLQATEKTAGKRRYFLGVASTCGYAAAGRSNGNRGKYSRAAGAEKIAEAHLIRCLVGNPFRPVTADPSWLTSAVTALARGIYADRAFDRLPVLADALQDAGCDHPDILAHCRSDGPHARGCWVVDLLLGKV